MKKHVLAVLFVVFSFHAPAQVSIKNSGTAKLQVAICYGNLLTGWTSKGWYSVAPGEEKSFYSPTALNYPTFYYCARIEQADQDYHGTTQLYIDPINAFTIQHADQTQNNSNFKTFGFRAVNLGTLKTYAIELKPSNLSYNGQPQGKWRVDLDKDGAYAEKKEDAYYYREVTFDQGKPIGWCKDYYPNGTLKAEFKLTQFRPAIYDGHCTWYNPDGTKQKEINYQNGTPISDHTVYDVQALPIQNFFLNNATRAAFGNGRSVIPYYFTLPPNTVKWYYEFTASRNKEDIQNLTANFQAAAKLASVADKSGLLAYSINLLTAPPGADYCNVYVTDQQYTNPLPIIQNLTYTPTASKLNYKSGITEVNEPQLKNPVIVFSNPSGFYGVSVSIQIVAIVAK